jgi:hypothetical protein
MLFLPKDTGLATELFRKENNCRVFFYSWNPENHSAIKKIPAKMA